MKYPPQRMFFGLFALCTSLWLDACGNGQTSARSPSGEQEEPTNTIDAKSYPAAPTNYRISTLPFTHSMVSLAPEWSPNNPSELSPLKPRILAWGNDPIFQGMDAAYWPNTVIGYTAIGVEAIALNIFMLSASAGELSSHPELQEATVVDIAGNKLVPPWLTETADGVPSYWGCTNNPTYRRHLDRRIELSSEAVGALLHIDDSMGTVASMDSGGCFCKYCMSAFREWLRTHRTAKELTKLSLSIDAMDTFDYAARVRAAGITTRSAYITALHNRTLPLRDEFIAFQRDAVLSVIEHLRNKAATTWKREVALGVNAWNMTPSQLADAHLVDYFANEIEHIGKEDSQAPFSYLLGTALGRPIFATASGSDWVQIQNSKAVKRVQGWLAQAYAFGHSFMYAYKKWGYSAETGTIWYDTPLTTYRPVTDLLNSHPELFDSLEPIRSVAVLYDAEAEANGTSRAMDVVTALHNALIPVSLVVAGNTTVRRELTESDLAPYTTIILPQQLSTVSKAQQAVIDTARKAGKVTVWTGLADFMKSNTAPMSLPHMSGVWALPRKAAENDSPLIVHLLNRTYDSATDTFESKSHFTFKVKAALLAHTPKFTVSYYAPEQEVQSLAVTPSGDWLTVTIPTLDYWGIVRFE